MRAPIGGSPLSRCSSLVLMIIAVGWAGGIHLGTAVAEEPRAEIGPGARPGEATAQRGQRVPAIEDGVIASFEDGAISATFGAGWAMNTDADAGGKSEAVMEPVAGGADGSGSSMRVSGKIVPWGGPGAWAGPIFFPGRRPYGAVDMSKYEGISFWVRGDGSPVSVVMFARSLREDPATALVSTTEEWTEHRLPFAAFDGVDSKGLTAIMFSGAEPGDFAFQIDELRVW